MENIILEKHTEWKGYNHKWYRESFIFLGSFYDHIERLSYDLFFGYEIADKHLKDTDPGYYSNKPIGVAVYGPGDADIKESTLMTASYELKSDKRVFDEIRSRACALCLIDQNYTRFNTVMEATKIIQLRQAGWKQDNRTSDKSRVWRISENTTVDTDTAFDMLILTKIKNPDLI